jgi:uncharacterized protein YbaP (TraB family)
MKTIALRAVLLAGLLALPFGLPAATSAVMEEVLVNGEQPGPGLWRVQHGDHRLWILGTITPLPAGLQWRSRELDQVLSQSQVLIAPVRLRTDIGLFKGLSLLPAALRARKLPEGQQLSDVLDAGQYQRWSVQRQRYLPGHRQVESWRPLFAVGELYDEALEKARLERRQDVWQSVRDIAERRKVPVREIRINLSIEDPRGVINDFARTPPAADLPCFDSLLLRVETQLPMLRERAAAWARGDVGTLRALPVEETERACLSAITSSPRIAREYEEALRRWRLDWVIAAESALLRNTGSVAVLPMRELLAADGLLAQLRARGYTVVAPDD